MKELKRLNVDVIRPSINNCFAEFKAEKNKIYYGLGAIKNVGFEAISNIVKEREKNGKFKSFIDFIRRVDPKNVNKLQLEGLVKAGAFDDIEKNRKKIFYSIPKIIQTIKNINEDKTSNQNNLFNNINDSEKDKFDFDTEESWTKKELLAEEFNSLGFYISDHPLNQYKELFSQLKIKSYKEFLEKDTREALIAGTIMSIQEKKSSKGNPFAIVKFSDNRSEFELFLFSDLLTTNREKLKESNSFVLTLQKDKFLGENTQQRVNVRKILDLSEIINKSYEHVSIELSRDYNIEELKEALKESGNTKINFIVRDKDKSFAFELEKTRKFDFTTFNDVKNKEYVKKISF